MYNHSLVGIIFYFSITSFSWKNVSGRLDWIKGLICIVWCSKLYGFWENNSFSEFVDFISLSIDNFKYILNWRFRDWRFLQWYLASFTFEYMSAMRNYFLNRYIVDFISTRWFFVATFNCLCSICVISYVCFCFFLSIFLFWQNLQKP